MKLGTPPDWSLIVGSLGKGFVFAAIAFFLISVCLWFGNKGKAGSITFVAGGLSLFGAFFSLASLFINHRFEFAYVYGHSDLATTLPYRIAAVWSGQEGSFLLWGCTSALFGILAAHKTGLYRRWFTILFSLFLLSIAAILAYESPFLLNLIDLKPVVPPDGQGLQPSLLNYWITIHPPTIFLGFGSLAVLFCWAFSALIERDLDSWIAMVRPWALVTVTLIGVGLCMGGFWAYETLGWGGFWMWDPVENVSFVPWCVAVAFVHGIFVQVARKKWQFGNAMLAGMAMLSFVYGTFLTRSGMLGDTSVHSFAEMNRSALRILIAILAVGLIAFFTTWIIRLRQMKLVAENKPESTPLHKEAFYAAGMWLILAIGVGASIGMSVPFIQTLTGQSLKSVEEHTYHLIIVWLYVPLMIAMGIAPFLSWRAMGFNQLFNRVTWVLCATLSLLGVFLFWIRTGASGFQLDLGARISVPFGYSIGKLPLMSVLIGVTLFVVIAALWRMIETFKKGLPALGGLVAHIGLGVTLLGLIISRGFERSAKFEVPEDKPVRVMDYVIQREGRTKTLFDRENKEQFRVQNDRENILMTPGLYYIERAQGDLAPFVWPFIHRHLTYDLYLNIGALNFDDPVSREFKVGEEVLMEQTLVKYKGMRMEGQPGQVGAKFIADVTARVDGKEYKASPTFAITDHGPERKSIRLTPTLLVQLDRMDAATKSVTLTVSSILAYYPGELLYKPFTGLVWLGVGIMGLGGALAAWSRRVQKRT